MSIIVDGPLSERQKQVNREWLIASVEYKIAHMRKRQKTLTLKFPRSMAEQLLRNLKGQL